MSAFGVDLVAEQPLYPLPSESMAEDQVSVLRADLNALKADVFGEIAAVENRLTLQIAKATDKMRLQMTSHTEEVKRYFDMIAEQIRHDLRDANHDHIELLKDHDNDYIRRIKRLEHRAGVIV